MCPSSKILRPPTLGNFERFLDILSCFCKLANLDQTPPEVVGVDPLGLNVSASFGRVEGLSMQLQSSMNVPAVSKNECAGVDIVKRHG